MDQFIPIPDEMEDQMYSKEVLYAHVTARTVQVFSGIALIATLGSIPFLKQTAPLTTRILTNSSRAVALGLVVGPVMTYGRMKDQHLVEWKDRSWRLLQNPGQNNVDIALTTGLLVGAVGAIAASSPPSIAMRLLGGAGIGSVAGIGLLAFLPVSRK